MSKAVWVLLISGVALLFIILFRTYSSSLAIWTVWGSGTLVMVVLIICGVGTWIAGKMRSREVGD